jgi:hypothetical protein
LSRQFATRRACGISDVGFEAARLGATDTTS